ncbi:MAG TPA: IPT/TIG domain-containing protein [Clostridia bacterium]|nr:IPT/TIG domain-containing protein [Clostridia bacterium]
MKRFMLTSRKFLSFLLTFIIVFSLFQDVMVVQAAPAISDIRFERVIDPANGTTETLYIYGSDLNEPIVRVGTSGSIPVQINESESNSSCIVIDDPDSLSEVKNRSNIINVTVDDGGTPTQLSGNIDLEVIPTIEGVSKGKVYVNDPLTISGSQFENLSNTTDTLLVAGTKYTIGSECIVRSESSIEIPQVKSPNENLLSDVRIERVTPGSQIFIIYKDSIRVVNRLAGIEVGRVDPNAGPRTDKNIISIYGTSTDLSQFTDDIRIFIDRVDESGGYEGKNMGLILNASRQTIGVKFELPIRTQAGTADLILCSKNLSSELTIPAAFLYLDIGNSLSIDNEGINPKFKKETEQKIIQIKGRNIGFFNGTGYDKITNVSPTAISPADIDLPLNTIIGYSTYGSFNNHSYYKLRYIGRYDNSKDVTIIRQFRVTIDGDATVTDSVYTNYSLSKDIIYVKPADVNLYLNEPKIVDVTIETITTVVDDSDPSGEALYTRSEKYAVKNGFTYLPNEISPEIEAITPDFGPTNNKEGIYMTITGSNFEVVDKAMLPPEKDAVPEVRVGNTKCSNVKVYDEDNNLVDGRILTLGTKIKCILPAGTTGDGAVDVVVVNPSGGERIKPTAFNFKIPNRLEAKMPVITQLREPYADIRGGIVSGETVIITGNNFDTSSNQNHRVLITIDGEEATILGRVSSDGRTVTIIPPPGTVPGETMLQLINEDGTMVSAEFVYKLITSNPKITSIVPIKGGKGTKLIIKGEDFILPDNSVVNNDPKKKGSVVLLGGMELNAYKYDDQGDIINANPDGTPTNDIYYDDWYDPDGDDDTDNSYGLNGHMVDVQDLTTIYVDIPDRFYSYAGSTSKAPYMKWTQIPLGSLKVEVLNPDGAKSKEDVRFNYMNPSTSPTIYSVSPNNGSVDGGTVVTIIGSDFREDDLEVYFGSELSADVQFINSGMLRALVPKYPYTLPTGDDELMVPVMVVNYDGGTAVHYDEIAEEGFRYRVPGSHPIITSIAPGSGSAAGKDTVILQGQDFRRSPDMTLDGLPKVYFNGREAEVIWTELTMTSVQSLKVITPSSLVSGPVDVVLVNYDSGTFTYKSFNYTKSQPKITSVMPNSMSNLGNVNVQINGSGLRTGGTSELFVSTTEKVNRHTGAGTSAAAAVDTIVAFGDESTGDKAVIDTVIGPPSAVIGDLRFDTVVSAVYQQVEVTISLASATEPTPIERHYTDTDGTPEFDSYTQADIQVGSSHLFILNHKMDLGSSNAYDEGILVETTPSSVTITRRIAPYAKVLDEGKQVDAKSPPVNKIGLRNLSVINDDRGTAVSPITILNPDSSPVITGIDPKNGARSISQKDDVEYDPNDIADYSKLYTVVPLDGGAFLTITGSDFRKGVKAYLNDMPLEIVSKSIDDDQLVVKIPQGTDEDADKDYRIVVVNQDGGTYDSTMLPIPHYIRYRSTESNPVISTITPDKSSSRGNNRINITGENFKAGVIVLIDGVACVTTREEKTLPNGDKLQVYQNIYAVVPTGVTPGKKTVQVQNTDFGIAEVKDGLTIISSPEITGIFDDKGDEINPLVLSVEGGEKIKLEGIQFMEGIKVIFGGTLKAKSELTAGESGLEGLNINNATMVIIGGTLATEVTRQADGSILCTTPKLIMGKTSVIVINSDSGISNEIAGQYQKPVPDTPEGLKVEVVDGDTLKLEWDKLEDVSYYEIYVSISENGKKTTGIYQYLGSIVPAEISETRLRYYLDGLMPSTWYSIKLRSVNLFGTSKYSNSTGYYKTLEEKVVTFYQDETANTGGVEQKDSTVINGLELTYTLGEKSVGSSTGAVVNFEQPSYIIADPKIVKISFELIKKHPSSKIKINDKDMELNLKASNLAVDEVTRVDNSLKDDTDMRVSIDRTLGAEGDEIRIRLPRGYKIMVNPFSINLNMQVQNTTTRIKSFNGDINLLLNYAESKKSLYPGGVYIAYYDRTTGKLQIITTQNLNGKAQSQIIKTGEYVLIGKLVK